MGSTIEIKYKNPESVMKQEKAKEFGPRTVTFPMEERPHYMQLTFTEYVNTDPEVNKLAVPQDKIVKHLILPIPAQLADGYNIRHAGTEFGVLGALAFSSGRAISNVLDKIDTTYGATLEDITNKFQGASTTGLGKAILRRIASLDAGVSGAIDRSIGTALNPHLISVFEGVDLRQFQFSWRVYPQSMTESREMQKVLHEIRRLIHPQENAADIGGSKDIFQIKYPHEVYGTIWVEDKPLIRIGRSVITNLGINYSPSGVPAFFKGTHDPVEIEFSINMQEVAYLTQQDIEGFDDYPGRASTGSNLTDSQGSF